VTARWVIAWLLAALSALLAPVAVAGLWFDRIMLDTERYTATVSAVIDDPAVQQALVDEVSDQVVAAVDVDELLSDAPVIGLIPGAAEGLADLLDPLLEAVEQAVRDGVGTVVASEGFAATWEAANRSAHAGLVAALTGRSAGVALSDTDVSIDADLVVDALRDGLVASDLEGVATLIPDVDAEIVVLSTEALPTIRATLRVLDVVGGWVWLVSVGLAAATVLVAPRRWPGLAMASGAVLVGALALTVVTGAARGSYVTGQTDVLTSAARAVVVDQVTTELVSATRLVLVLSATLTAAAVAIEGVRRRGSAVRRARADQSP
jgi:hypothetical protein